LSVLILLLTACQQTEQENHQDREPGVAVLLVDTDRKTGDLDDAVYGHFLEHINHSVVDGLYAEQIRGQGFEGSDFEMYWEIIDNEREVSVENVPFKNGEKSLRLHGDGGSAGIKQNRIYLQDGIEYNGSVWVKPEAGSPEVKVSIMDAPGNLISEIPLVTSGTDWQELSFSFNSSVTDTSATLEISTNGTIFLDFISLMRADVRVNGKLRPDLLQALDDLKPPFLRWPGGSFASTYKWKDGIGPQVSRTYHPNEMWGGYPDYYGFGTDEFLELCRQLDTKPMIVLAATSTDPEEVQYAMDWVHYLIDPVSTEWGKMRAENGHPEPYDIPYFQIDNEPMNHGLTPDEYAEIVNVYGRRLREIAPHSEIVACGQKRSNDMIWSQKLIDIAGENFDILGCHNYEYEPENFQTGVRRIEDYLEKLQDYIRSSEHPTIKPTVLEWGLCRSYDWRAGLHAAGSLISYEKLGLDMACPALLMRNSSDDPTWTAWIYHDHVSWFPGAAYVVQKLFREHYAPYYLASTSGTFRNLEDPSEFFDDISQMKPEDWQPGTVDAIATSSDDGSHLIIKAVNYTENDNILAVRLQGANIPDKGAGKSFTVKAGLMDSANLSDPNKIRPVEDILQYDKDMTIELEPYSVVVLNIELEPESK
ncbi:MAG: carbohydrate binding domain-containing protein, partial [Cyclobacteriaceae bacterium]